MNRVKEGKYGQCIFYTCMNIETCQSNFKRGKRENYGGDDLTRVHYTHKWKRHNEIPCTTIIC
jgi:hypothetical protein